MAISCTQADIDEPEKPITPVVPVIDISISEITIPDTEAGSATFTTNNSWTIQTSDTKAAVSWFDVTPKSGDAGSNTLTITIKESNPNYEDRSAYIHIKSGELTKTITVSQKKKEAILVSKDRYEIEPLGGSFAVEVKSNVTYQVVIPDESTAWISHISSKGLSTSTENFSVAAGSLDGKREGMVIFVSGALKDTVHVYQSQLNCIILTDKTININEKTQNFPVELKTNIDYDISFIGGDW
ncbi:MAG: BACON domain-containing protein, partial [Rikenellaceae bacterium]